MGVPEQILIELEGMDETQRAQVLDFARFLRRKEECEVDRLADEIIEENAEALKELAK